MKVILCRYIRNYEKGREGYYARWADSPLPPFVGLGFVLDDDSNPCPVEEVFVNRSGDVVCVLEEINFNQFPLRKWPARFARYTGDWFAVGSSPCRTTPEALCVLGSPGDGAAVRFDAEGGYTQN
jgi:hypothetical protein